MVKARHIAIDRTVIENTDSIISSILKGEYTLIPELIGKKGLLFSFSTLMKFISEEATHDKRLLDIGSDRSIKSLSSGEQKRALLNFILSKSPDFIIIENPFDALDTQSISDLIERLTALSKEINICQVYNRDRDIMPFITDAIAISDKDGSNYIESISTFIESNRKSVQFNIKGDIPQPVDRYNLDSDEIVRFNSVNVDYDKRAILKDINWTINQGEFWHLKGANGSGKTTILTMINGDNPKAFGEEIYLFGKRKGSGESVWQIKNYIGYFTPSMMEPTKGYQTVLNMVVSGLTDSIGLYRKVSNLSIKLAEEWLKLVDLYSIKDRQFSSIPEVERRVVLIIRAMIKHPPILILDEPSMGLDDYNRSIMSLLINKISAESESSILYVSHQDEPELTPKYIYQLTPSAIGSTGEVIVT